MRQVGIALALVAFLASIGGAADPKKVNYYPMTLGSKWDYEAKAADKTLDALTEVAKIEVIDGVSLARVESSINGTVTTAEHMSSTDKGIFRNRYAGVELSPPICLLRYPVKVGDAWEDEVKIGAGKFKVKGNVEKFEDVEVPAGKFKTVKVHLKTIDKGQEIEATYWFADGVGIVKQDSVLPQVTVKMELQEYMLGK